MGPLLRLLAAMVTIALSVSPAKANEPAALIDQANSVANSQPQEALRLLEMAKADLLARGETGPLRVRVEYLLARTLMQSGRYEEGVLAATRASHLAESEGDTHLTMGAAQLAIGALRRLGRAEEANALIVGLLERVDPEDADAAYTLSGLALAQAAVLTEAGDAKAALEAANKGVAMIASLTPSESVTAEMRTMRLAQARHTRGTIHLALGDADSALPDLEAALPAYRDKPGFAAYLVNANEAIGAAYSALGDYGPAEAAYRRALTPAVSLYAPGTIEHARLYANLADSIRQPDRRREALAAAETARASLTLRRRSKVTDAYAATPFDREVSRELAGTFLRMSVGVPDDADLLDATIAKVQELQLLGSGYAHAFARIQSDEAAPALAAARAEAVARFRSANAALTASLAAGGAEAVTLDRLRSKQAAARVALDRIEMELIAAGAVPSLPLTVGEVQARLAPDERLLVIHADQDAIHTIIVSADTIEANSLDANAATLCVQVAAFRRDLGFPETVGCPTGINSVPTPLRTADEIDLLSELAAVIARSVPDGGALIVSATGPAAALPWAALPLDGERVLLDAMRVAHLPSLSRLEPAATRRPRFTQEARYLGLGAPCFEPSGVCAPPTAETTRAAVDPFALPALPGAIAELEAIGSRAGRKQRLLVGRAATRSKFAAAVRQGPIDILAVSTHALTAAQSDLGEPAFVLTASGPEGDRRSALLTPSDLTEMGLRTRLAFLSGCASASPNAGDTTGTVSGFVEALIAAGAEAVFATHASVADADLAALTVRLADGVLADGLAYDQALRRAALAERTARPGSLAWANVFVSY